MNSPAEIIRYKRSRQRERILDVLRGTDSHPTAAWVYDELRREFPGLSLGTIYRNLGILKDQGFVRILQSGSTFDRFDADTRPHYHFVCDRCGKVSDVSMDVSSDLNARASAALGCAVSGHRLDFFGVCASCASVQPGVAEAAPGS
jgi:Fur family peroxide stress response transcriptional regulator